mgnify:CR=1 FL=1
MVDFITGVLQIANLVLAVIAGLIAASMFAVSKKEGLRPWKPLAAALIFFALEEIFGGLRSFGIYSNAWITHVIPSIILAFLIWGLVAQINVIKEAKK